MSRASRARGRPGLALVLACGAASAGCAPFAPRAGQLSAGSSEEERVQSWLSAMTVDEKVAALQVDSPAVPRLGLPAYGWWNEALHGLARQGTATVFPQSIALAATFDPSLVAEIGAAIAAEARLKDRLRHGDATAEDLVDRAQDQGLTFFSPNVNLDRDPRWGRGQETYGEDPLLVSEMSLAFVRGLQGEREWLDAAATAKHFAVHSGPEALRHQFDARVEEEELRDTYLPAFERTVRQGKVAMVMAAYNAINGVPVAASRFWLTDTLRGQWGFVGPVVGDCGAVGDLVSGHHVAEDATHAAALALKAGLDLDCGRTFGALRRAVAAGLVATSDLDAALARLFRLRLRLGLLGPRSGRSGPSAEVTVAATSRENTTRWESLLAEHRALALRAARESLVLLENRGGVPLPLTRGRRLLVVGPAADDLQVLLGNYHGDAREPVTIWQGLAAAARAREIEVSYAHGTGFTRAERGELARAVAAARAADVVVAVMGLSPRLEGEEGDRESDNPAGDRTELQLPRAQRVLLDALARVGRPLILVLTGGGALTHPSGDGLAAALMAWYPGQEGGRAVADALFGATEAAGHLPVTFYRSVADLPPFTDYHMKGRTYRFVRKEVAWPFGHGVTTARLAAPELVTPTVLEVSASNGEPASREAVVQVYAVAPSLAGADPAVAALPFATLLGFARLALAPRETRRVSVTLDGAALARFTERLGAHRPQAPVVHAVGTHAPSAAWVGSLVSRTLPSSNGTDGPFVIPP